MDVGFTLDLR